MTKDEEKPEPQEKPPVDSGEKRGITVDLSEDHDDREEKGAGGVEPQQRSKSPDPRRKSEWRQFKEKHEETVTSLQRKIEELERRPPAYYQPPPQQQQPQHAKGDEVETQIQDLWDQQQVVLAGVPPDASSEQKARAANIWRKLDRQRRALESKADVAREEGPRDDVPAENRRLNEYVQDEFPEVASDQSLALEAEAELLRILRQPGRVKSRATVREACERVKNRHGIGRKVPGPTDLERSRYGSTPARPGANGGGNGQLFTPNKLQLQMARAFTSHLDIEDEERVRIWATNARKDGVI